MGYKQQTNNIPNYNIMLNNSLKHHNVTKNLQKNNYKIKNNFVLPINEINFDILNNNNLNFSYNKKIKKSKIKYLNTLKSSELKLFNTLKRNGKINELVFIFNIITKIPKYKKKVINVDDIFNFILFNFENNYNITNMGINYLNFIENFTKRLVLSLYNKKLINNFVNIYMKIRKINKLNNLTLFKNSSNVNLNLKKPHYVNFTNIGPFSNLNDYIKKILLCDNGFYYLKFIDFNNNNVNIN
jgi:hypothetical protein